jgi:transposase
LKRQGLVVDSQTLWEQINALAKWLVPAHEQLHSYVLAQPVIGADETFIATGLDCSRSRS